MKKRFLSVFLALALCLGLCAVPGFAADSDFEIDEDGWLLDYTGPGGDVVIPDGVTMIGWYAFSGREDLTSITFPEGVTDIGPESFWGCTNLTSIKFSSSVTRIEPAAFYGCTSLTSVTLPNGFTSIEGGAFADCTSLTDITIPDSVTYIDGTAFDGTPWLERQGEFVVVNGILLKYRGSAADVVVPSNVTQIGSYAFRAYSDSPNTDLISVTIPNGVTFIGKSAFFSCANLSTLTMPASVTYIDGGAFENCDSLKDVYYGGSEAQWNEIFIDTTMTGSNSELLNAAIHYNSAMPAPAPSFTDVPNWCSSAVDWAIEAGVTDGVGGNRFAPSSQCTNAMILTFLWRAAGELDAQAPCPVTLPANLKYAENALRWAAEKGMIDGTLDPAANCSRASAVSYIWQVLGKDSAPASGFDDVPAGADYAAAVDWAVANGIVEGYPDGSFHPDTVCNRGVIVTMLHRTYVPEVRLP